MGTAKKPQAAIKCGDDPTCATVQRVTDDDAPVDINTYRAKRLALAAESAVDEAEETRHVNPRYERVVHNPLWDENARCITVAGIKARGWTDGLIAQYLGGPDLTLPNTKYTGASPMRLYMLGRICFAEDRNADLGYQLKLAAHRKFRKYDHRYSEDEIRKMVEQARVRMLNVPIGDEMNACLIHFTRYGFWKTILTPDRSQKQKEIDAAYMLFSFLRQNYVAYDEDVERFLAKERIEAGIVLLRRMVLSAIGEMFPSLDNACQTAFDMRYGMLAV